MTQVIWNKAGSLRRLSLPKEVNSIEEMMYKPFPNGTEYVIINNDHPAISVPTSKLSVNFSNGHIAITDSFPIITIDDVITERERRFSLGFYYDFGDERGIHHIGTTEADLKGWDEVEKASSALIALGMSSQTISIVTETGPVNITAMEWKQIILAATAHRQPIWQGSFYLQTLNPIPQNYKDDMWWGA